jgi:hypothetical protein
MNLDNHISTLGLNNRAINALTGHGAWKNGKFIKINPIDTIEKLISLTENELSSILNLGKISKNHIKNQLNLHGLSLKNTYIKPTPAKQILFEKNINLRDYFAAKAMQSLLTHEWLYLYDKAEKIGLEDWDDYVVETAYFMADKMMKARKAELS